MYVNLIKTFIELQKITFNFNERFLKLQSLWKCFNVSRCLRIVDI